MYDLNKTYRKGRGDVPVLSCIISGEPVLVLRKEVKAYVEDPTFQKAMYYYNLTKLWGMPNGNGWANEPTLLLDAITAIEMEAKEYEAEQMKNPPQDPNKFHKGGSRR